MFYTDFDIDGSVTLPTGAIVVSVTAIDAKTARVTYEMGTPVGDKPVKVTVTNTLGQHSALVTPPTTGGIGDVTSDAIGSGARYNTGKAQLDLLPLSVVASTLRAETHDQAMIKYALDRLGVFQRRERELDAAGDLIMAMDYAGQAAGLDMPAMLAETAHVLEYGKGKYAAWNWSKGMPWSVPLACASRHLLLAMWQDPTALDPESGRLHAGHVGANLMMLLQYLKTYPEGDDRPTTLYRSQ